MIHAGATLRVAVAATAATRALVLLTLLVTSGRSLAASPSVSPAASTTDDTAQFYRGKSITLVVSAEAGTITDLIARQFKDHFARHIPGQPRIVVVNLAGAGGMIAAARLQLQDPQDGTVIGFLQRNNLYVPLVENNHKNFDPRQLSWIGSLDKTAYTMAVSYKSPVKTVAEIFSKRTIIGATGFASDNRTLPALMNKYAGTQFRIINGYSGRGEVYIAMDRGEVDGWASTVEGLQQPEQAAMIKRGLLIPLMHLAWTSHPAFPNLPNLSSYVRDAEGKAVIDFFLRSFEPGRPLAVPKGVPAARLKALRLAFDATMKDPAFVTAMRQRGYAIDPISGAGIETLLNQLYATAPATLSAVREVLAPPRKK
jgi:tripartite-type tricarboxylate transporter receptor subunit TctC